MKAQEPSSLEIMITAALGDLAAGLFKEYIDRLPLTGSERILELGPSAGNSTRPLARRLLPGGGCVTAVDISPKWAAVARKRLRELPNVEILLGNVITLPLPDKSYDALFFSFVIHEISADGRLPVLKTMLQKLVPAGKVFLREPLRFICEQEIHQLSRECGLVKTSCTVRKVKTQGQAFEGVYQKERLIKS